MGTPDTLPSAPEVARRILRWYRHNGRSLPWRQTRRPYRVLLSEVMLQQTQVARVEQKYPEFLRRFPTLRALARARRRDVVISWRGLGYNNRAVRLHALARHLHSHCSGRFPRTVNALQQLPGVGRYTAHAVAVFSFGQPLPVVDVNIRRVLSRMFSTMRTTDAVLDESAVWAIAGDVLPAERAYDWNQALMDLGARICTAVRPRCADCPVADACTSGGRMKPAKRRPLSRHRPPAHGERLHRGTPLRLYRGRVVEALRNAHPRRSLPATQVGRAILPQFTERDRQVFGHVLQGLERDGLVEVRRNRRSLPERISLA